MKFDNETGRMVRDGVPSEVNHFDLLATCLVEDLKEGRQIEHVAFTMGPPQAREALNQCLATGADRAVHLVDRAFAGSDTLATARALSMAIKREQFDLIICGRNSVDAETGQVGPEIAEMLGLPQVTAVRKLEVSEDGKEIIAERVTDEGYDVVRCPLPALITVTEDVAAERYPDRDALTAAAEMTTEVEGLSASDLSEDLSLFGSEGSPTWVDSIYSVESEREKIIVRDVPTDEAVSQLMEFLESRGAFDENKADESTGIARGPRTQKGDAGAIWVIAELLRGEIRPVTLELLGRSRELAEGLNTTVEAILIGSDVRQHVATLTAYGADRVYIADDERLKHYDTEQQTVLISHAISQHKPYAVLMPASTMGRDLAGRIAGRLSLGLTGDCVGLQVDSENRLVQEKPAFGGNIIAPILSKTTPNMATIRPGVLTPVAPDESAEAVVEELDIKDLPNPSVQVTESVLDESAEGAELDSARIIVGVGMGIGGPENLPIIRELAGVLDAPIGATRDLTDKGWLPRQYQIGLSGKSVSPELYIAVALRGPFNHSVGIQKSGTVIAINNSRRAQIFQAADFGILGDYAEIVPVLTEALNRRLNS